MRTVVDNKTLAELWIAQSQPHARSSSGSFSGANLLSYGTTIASIIKSKRGTAAYLINETQYSKTTSVLRGIVESALPTGAVVFRVPGVDRYLSGNFADRKRIIAALEAKRRARLDESEKSREPKKSRMRSDAEHVQELADEYAAFTA